MPKPKTISGGKNLVADRVTELRHKYQMSQKFLAYQLQMRGYNMDKNVITRIETNQRYVSDLELKALAEIFDVSYQYLLDGNED